MCKLLASKWTAQTNQLGVPIFFLAHSIPIVFFFSENYPIQCCFDGDDNNKVGENHQLTHRIPVATTVLNIAQSMCWEPSADLAPGDSRQPISWGTCGRFRRLLRISLRLDAELTNPRGSCWSWSLEHGLGFQIWSNMIRYDHFFVAVDWNRKTLTI